LVQALAHFADKVPESRGDDEAIRARILAELDKQSWAPSSTVNVIVRNAIAELRGTIFDEREREAVRVAAENVPGITSVKDHLVGWSPYLECSSNHQRMRRAVNNSSLGTQSYRSDDEGPITRPVRIHLSAERLSSVQQGKLEAI
jgi:hypothetical protein